MKTRIIVDSTADLVPEIKARVSTVPLTVHFGQEEYIDGVTIDNKTFYEKLIESDVLPTTSQATPDAFIKEFEKARQAGESAVVITLASKFSGTYQSAMIAAADYENIYVVDGTSAAMGTGILVELAFRLLDAGMTAEETAQALEEEKKKIVVVALVDGVPGGCALHKVAYGQHRIRADLKDKVSKAADNHVLIAPSITPSPLKVGRYRHATVSLTFGSQ